MRVQECHLIESLCYCVVNVMKGSAFEVFFEAVLCIHVVCDVLKKGYGQLLR